MTDKMSDRKHTAVTSGQKTADADLASAQGNADAAASTREQVLEQERDQFKDLLLRKSAEFDNYRKRIERERRDQAERGVADLLEEMLPIVDDLDRALKAEAVGEQAQAYRTGVELIYRQMIELLKRRGVTPFDAVGSDFDPNIHQAVISEEAPGRRDGEVLEQFQRGYMIGDRLLRAAVVKVARA